MQAPAEPENQPETLGDLPEWDWSDLYAGPDAPELKADPSQGSHFFHNITSLGITYITVSDNNSDYLDWEWLNAQVRTNDLHYMAHVQLKQSMRLKVDGRSSHCVILTDESENQNGR